MRIRLVQHISVENNKEAGVTLYKEHYTDYVPRVDDFIHDSAFDYPGMVESIEVDFEQKLCIVHLNSPKLAEGKEEELKELVEHYRLHMWESLGF